MRSRVHAGERVGRPANVADDLPRYRGFDFNSDVERRGPAPEARACYSEDEAVVKEREQKTAALRQDRMLMPRTAGRPDKHTRRKLRDDARARPVLITVRGRGYRFALERSQAS